MSPPPRYAGWGSRVGAALLDATMVFAVRLAEDIDAIVAALDASAKRAQMLWDALAETPGKHIERRIEQLRGILGKSELLDALQSQHAVHRRMHVQLERSMDEFERVVVELNTIRGHLVSSEASYDSMNRERLAASVRTLRNETNALADGAFAAYS